MTTAGHIAKAMRDIDDEVDKNDWVTAVIDIPGVGGGVVDRLIELRLPVTLYDGGERQSARSDSSMLELRTTEHCGNCSRTARSRSIPMTTSSPRGSVPSSGASTPADASRSNPKTTCPRGGCQHRIGQTQWRWRSLDVQGQTGRR
jgi:hypothetical protein